MDLKDPKKQKLLLALIGAAALVYVYLMYGYIPKAKEISARETHLVSLRQHVESARDRVEQSDERRLRSELLILEEELLRAEALLPLEEEVPLLLKEVERKGIQSGVSSVLFEPRGAQPAELYTEHSYRLSVRGGYHSIGLFLARVAGLKRIICPKDLSLVTGKLSSESETQEAMTTVIADFDMITYTTPREKPAGEESETAVPGSSTHETQPGEIE
jgi:type IV pilus assembly protein PilO